MRATRQILLLLIATCGFSVSVHGQGLVFPSAGGMHGSMAGASTARGVDALGALYWNPATITALDQPEIVMGGMAVYPQIHLGSTIPAGSFGPFPT